MAIKTILLCLTTPASAETLMKAAVPLARRFRAHLIGLHTHESLVIYPAIAMHIPSTVFANFNTSQNAHSAEIKAIFERHTRTEDFASEWRLIKADTVSSSEHIIESAHAADLVIMAQDTDGSGKQDHDDVINKVISDSGRPVLVLPHDYDGQPIGDNMLLGWTTTREATRAAHDLLDIANEGGRISVLTVASKDHDTLHDAAATGMAETYHRHGLRPEIIHRQPNGQHVVDVILKEAFETGADLIATGAFGHSRSYDMIFGAVTRDLMSTAPLPVLFSR